MMTVEIEVRYETKRGCGFRQPGGMYLVSGGAMAPCGKLPIPLDVCPCCNAGIKPSRGWTWVNGTALAANVECKSGAECDGRCPLASDPGRVGLLWVGEKFYPTPREFMNEGASMGISRRISAIPRDFKLGETWVWFAHRKAIANADGTFSAAVFTAFRPTAIEYIVKGDETEEELEKLVERGFTLVDVKRVTDPAQAELPIGE